MRFMLKNFKIRYLMIFFIFFSVLIFFYFIENFSFFKNHTLCIFKNLTGISCPGCGMGRGAVCLLHGKFKEAMEFNLLIFPFFGASIIGVCWMIFDILRNKETFFPLLKKKFHPIVMIIVLVVFIMNWIWNIYRGF